MPEDEVRRFRVWLRRFSETVHKNRALVETCDVPWYLKPIELLLIDRDKYMIKGEGCVDYFIRYEDLWQGVRNVCDVLGIEYDGRRIPEYKKGIRHHLVPVHEYYDVESQEIVRELYAWEIERFCYSLPVLL